jgi:hypothetical protein
LYSGLGWEIGNEGQILFTDPLCTPKVLLIWAVFIYLFVQCFWKAPFLLYYMPACLYLFMSLMKIKCNVILF